MLDIEFVNHLLALYESGHHAVILRELENEDDLHRILNLAKYGSHGRPKRQVRPRAPVLPGMELPPWWPAPQWKEFLKMRRAKRLPLTERAVELITKAVTDLRAKGQDPAAIIDQSIRKGWTDVYPLKDFQPVLRVVGGTQGSGNWDINQEG